MVFEKKMQKCRTLEFHVFKVTKYFFTNLECFSEFVRHYVVQNRIDCCRNVVKNSGNIGENVIKEAYDETRRLSRLIR